ncbi:hypothetical protein H310_01257 [Aphanomyces invadans]|uniref:Uncharacterized protein n=1 Tax=Aphanomyces invadans TaxID=157072 RepID=A0A024URC0_9STRA|nr:hypothetical protein H310_01257 [Aphanomyces invadans]ETW08735.1 hypothetical protein H310_01257 [Aphanomyces invadans]|eukprot:XP_008862540.1 hypothetical protein H310_01257 [Aphanomyces invadans]
MPPGTYTMHTLDIPDVSVHKVTPASPIVYDIVPPPVHGTVQAYFVQLRASTRDGSDSIVSEASDVLRVIESDMDVHDVVFAAQRSGFRALLCLIQQYPQHVNVASYATAAIVRIMEKRRQSEDSPAHDDKWSASSDDSDDDVCDHNAMHSSEIVSDLVDIVLKRMETFASDVNMQQWGTRAASCILMHELNKPAETLLQGVVATTYTYVHLVLRAMSKLCANASMALWGAQDLANLFTKHRQFVSVMAERGGVEVCADVMRAHEDNLLIQRWGGQVVLLCVFWDARLQEVAKGEGLLHLSTRVLDDISDESDARNNALMDILLCLRLVMENVGKIHANNSELLVSRYDDGSFASIISTDVIPNSLGGKIRHQAAVTITRFVRYIVSSKRMETGGGGSLLAVLRLALARRCEDGDDHKAENSF